MTDEEQKAIFSKNLKHYIEINQKQQKEVADYLGFKQTTFSMWCQGKSMPETGKIRKLADYFGIGMSDLTDERSQDHSDSFSDACLKIALNDERFKNIIIRYNELPLSQKRLICDFFEEFIL